eukprot:5874059-Amphidinium_carterae.1
MDGWTDGWVHRQDLYAKPSWASVTLRKAGATRRCNSTVWDQMVLMFGADLLKVKKLPKGLITKGPSKSVATLKYANATEVHMCTASRSKVPGGVGFQAIMAFNKLIVKALCLHVVLEEV